MFGDVGLGILTWRDYSNLRLTLTTLVSSGFAASFGERVIYFNEIDDVAREIASEFGFVALGTSENFGIYGGFRGLSEGMRSDYVLLIENDRLMIESGESAIGQVSFGRDILESGRACVVQYQHLRSPGIAPVTDSRLAAYFRRHPVSDYPYLNRCMARDYVRRFMRYYPSSDASLWDRLLAYQKRWSNPNKAGRFVGYSAFVMDSPESRFGEIERDESSGFFLMPCRYMGWHNGSSLVGRNFFIDEILSYIESFEASDRHLINGMKDTECILLDPKNDWWWTRDWRVCLSNPGLFCHHRVDFRD